MSSADDMKQLRAYIAKRRSTTPKPQPLDDWRQVLGVAELGTHLYMVNLVIFGTPPLSANRHGEPAIYMLDSFHPPHGFVITVPVQSIEPPARGPPYCRGGKLCAFLFTLLQYADPPQPRNEDWFERPQPTPEYTISLRPFDPYTPWDLHVPYVQDRYRFPFVHFAHLCRMAPWIQGDLLLGSLMYSVRTPDEPDSLRSETASNQSKKPANGHTTRPITARITNFVLRRPKSVSAPEPGSPNAMHTSP